MSGSKSNGGRQAKRKGRRRRKSKKSESAKISDFWGQESASIDLEHDFRTAPQPTAMVASLGSPPLLDHTEAAETYFSAVYQRATLLAGALGAAGGLVKDEP